MASTARQVGTLRKENISLEITTRCNHHCLHCFARAGLSAYGSLSYVTITQFLEEAYRLGYRNLHLTGGEPLLHADFFAILAYACSIGYEQVFCNSNGTLLTKEKCRLLSVYKHRVSFSISLQGDQAIHEYICGKGSYAETLKGINNALQAGLTVTIFTSVGKSLLPGMQDYAIHLFRNYPAIHRLTFLQVIRVNNDVYDMSEELLAPEDFIRFVRIISSLCVSGLPVQVLDNPLVLAAARQLGLKGVPETSLLHRPDRLILMANGTIGIDHATRGMLGTYQKGILEHILESEQYLKQIGADRELCPQCQFYRLCRSAGLLQPSEWFRSIDSATPYCQRVLSLARSRTLSSL